MAAPVLVPGGTLPKSVWQSQFVHEVSAGTGIPSLVMWAWVYAEGGPQGNPLNIGPGRNYGDHHAAARATIALLKTKRYAPILRAARGGDEQDVIAAIVASPWDAGHYRNGTLLRGTYARAKGEHPSAGAVVEKVTSPITEPIERAAASVEHFLVERSKLALAYVGLTGAAVVLFVIGLQLATGVPGVAAKLAATRGMAGGAGAGAQGGEIPF